MTYCYEFIDSSIKEQRTIDRFNSMTRHIPEKHEIVIVKYKKWVVIDVKKIINYDNMVMRIEVYVWPYELFENK